MDNLAANIDKRVVSMYTNEVCGATGTCKGCPLLNEDEPCNKRRAAEWLFDNGYSKKDLGVAE